MFLISDALAQGAPAAEQQSPVQFFLLMGGMLAVFYFMIIRPQSKRQKEHKSMLDALSKGDEVVTSGGIVGRVAEITEQYVTLQVGASGSGGDKSAVSILVQRSAVQTLLPKGTIKTL
jgi:preprotein translocase subunit YajC